MPKKSVHLLSLAFAGLSLQPILASPLLNEVHFNAPGADDVNYQYVEILTVDGAGKPVSESLNGHSVVFVDSNGNSVGAVTVALNLNGKKTGANGLLLIGVNFAKGKVPYANVAAETEVVNLTEVRAAGSEAELGPKSGASVLLVRGFNAKPTDDLDRSNTGSFSNTPWDAIVDAIGFGDKPYEAKLAITSAADNLSRIAGRVDAKAATAWYGGEIRDTTGAASTGFDKFFGSFAGSATPGQPNLAVPVANPIRINEVLVNPPGQQTDGNFEYIELTSTSGSVASTDGLWLLLVDSNSAGATGATGAVGEVRRAWSLAGQKTGTNGLLLLGNKYTRANNPWSSLVSKETEVFEPAGMGNDDIGDNKGFSLLLVKGFTGKAALSPNPGDDLDTNDDGQLDKRPWDTSVGEQGIIDSVGFGENDESKVPPVLKSKTYALADLSQISPTLAYHPDALFRKPKNYDTNSKDAWAGGAIAGQGQTSVGIRKDRTFGGFRGVLSPGQINPDRTPPQELVLINEVQIDPVPSPDGRFEYIELLSPNRMITPLNELELILVDMSGADRGTIKNVFEINGYSTGNNGLMIIGDSYDSGIPYPEPSKETHAEDPQQVEQGDIGPKDNNSLAILLVQGFTGARNLDLDTNNDGVFDAKPWASVMDSVGFGEGLKQTENFANLNGKGMIPDSICRLPGSISTNDAAAWYGGTILAGSDASVAYEKFFGPFKGEATPGRLNLAGPRASVGLLINEVHANPSGADSNYEYVELITPLGERQSTHGYSLVLLDGAGTKSGQILEVWNLDGMSTGSDGLLLLGNRYAPTPVGTAASVVSSYWDRSLSPNTTPSTPFGEAINGKIAAVGYPVGFGSDVIPNSPLNLFLVEGFTGALGEDLDADDNGVLDKQPWKSRRDSIGFRNFVTASGAFEGRVYTATDISQRTLTPDNVSRRKGNIQADQSAAWYGGDIVTDKPGDLLYGEPFLLIKGQATPGTINLGEDSTDALDDDKDGVLNLNERVAGTDPKNPHDFLRMNQATRNGQRVVVEWRSVSGKSYTVEYSDDLEKGTWHTISEAPVSATAASANFTDLDPIRLAKPRGFYRVRVQQ